MSDRKLWPCVTCTSEYVSPLAAALCCDVEFDNQSSD